jgi:predicted small secreted protein
MKRIFVAVVLVAFTAFLLTSCGAARYGAGKGCPTTNPKYFRG